MQENGKARFAVADLSPYLSALLGKLFDALAMPDSGENEYLMRCIMQIISFVGPQVNA